MPTPIFKTSTNVYLIIFDVYHIHDFKAVQVIGVYDDFKKCTDNVFLLNTTDSMGTINEKLNKDVGVGAIMIVPFVPPYFSTPQGPLEDWLYRVQGW